MPKPIRERFLPYAGSVRHATVALGIITGKEGIKWIHVPSKEGFNVITDVPGDGPYLNC